MTKESLVIRVEVMDPEGRARGEGPGMRFGFGGAPAPSLSPQARVGPVHGSWSKRSAWKRDNERIEDPHRQQHELCDAE